MEKGLAGEQEILLAGERVCKMHDAKAAPVQVAMISGLSALTKSDSKTL